VLALLLSVALLLGAGILIGHGFWTQTSGPGSATGALPFQPPSTGSSLPSSGPTGSGGPANAASIAAKVNPGLVDINTSLSYQSAQAAGTGMVLTSSGEVLTNNHVIEGATNISVTDVGNGQTYGATVVGYDLSRDLAVLQLHNASGLQTVSLGDSSKVAVGQSVVGVGNAGGTGGTPSFAGGSVTALNQSIAASDQFNSNSEQLTGLIEFNADIQPGDSGGALVGADGRVIGITTAASSGLQFQTGGGAAYAIPINTGISLARQIESGRASATVHIGPTAFLGVEVTPVNGSGFGQIPSGGGFGSGSGQGSSPTAGVGVYRVVTGDPADQAGISAGDVITSVGGTTVNSPSDLTNVLLGHHPGDKVQIVWTDQAGASHTSSVQLASGPPQ